MSTIANTLTQSIINHQLNIPVKQGEDTDFLKRALVLTKIMLQPSNLKLRKGNFFLHDEFFGNESGVINL